MPETPKPLTPERENRYRKMHDLSPCEVEEIWATLDAERFAHKQAQSELAAAKERDRLWERLAKACNENGRYLIGQYRIGWGSSSCGYGHFAWSVDAPELNAGPFRSLLDALAAIEQWESANAGNEPSDAN